MNDLEDFHKLLQILLESSNESVRRHPESIYFRGKRDGLRFALQMYEEEIMKITPDEAREIRES